MKFTFKKEPRETGLAAVGNPRQSVHVKRGKKWVGIIYAPNWRTKDHKWSISLTVEGSDGNPNCSWRWVNIATRFDTEQEARDWLNANYGELCSKYTLHEMDPY